MGGHDLVRRMDRQGEVLRWCRKCPGYARQRMGPKLMNYCQPEQMGTKEYGKMSKRIQVLEDGRVPAKKAKKFEMEGFMAHKELWNLAREEVMRDRGVLPQEEGDVNREYKAMHEENFLSSWLREEEKEREEIMLETGEETQEERSKKRRRGERRERNGSFFF